MKRKPAIIRRRVLPVATIPEKLVLEFKRFLDREKELRRDDWRVRDGDAAGGEEVHATMVPSTWR